jgi:ornithine cyclodeaminase/alanine dehydrogenase-like protein (mu-crystallin family)
MLPSTDTRADKHNELKFERVTSVREDFLPSLRNQNVPFVQLSEQASHNGELVHAVEAGAVDRSDVTELGEVLNGSAPGRRSDDEITAFDSTGLAIQDLAIALAAMERAGELDLPTLDL